MSTDSSPQDSLDQQEALLRRQKLQLEIKDLKRPWLRPAVVLPVLGTALAAGAVIKTDTLNLLERENRVKVVKLEEDLHAHQTRVRELQKTEGELRVAIDQQRVTISSQGDQITSMAKTVTGLQVQIDQREDQLSDLTNKVASKDRELRDARKSLEATYPAYRKETLQAILDRLERDCFSRVRPTDPLFRTTQTLSDSPRSGTETTTQLGNPFSRKLLGKSSLSDLIACLDVFDPSSALTSALTRKDRDNLMATWQAHKSPIGSDLRSLLASIESDPENARVPPRFSRKGGISALKGLDTYPDWPLFGQQATKAERNIDLLVGRALTSVRSLSFQWAQARAREA